MDCQLTQLVVVILTLSVAVDYLCFSSFPMILALSWLPHLLQVDKVTQWFDRSAPGCWLVCVWSLTQCFDRTVTGCSSRCMEIVIHVKSSFNYFIIVSDIIPWHNEKTYEKYRQGSHQIRENMREFKTIWRSKIHQIDFIYF